MEQAAWEKGYQPWHLVARAMLTLGKQAAILIFTYSQVCDWNSANHRVMMHCRRDWIGGWAYTCEATKAFARSFPLVAASISMATAARFILQSRLFYHLIRKGALLDYDNYHASRDVLAMALAACFTCSLMHFVLDLCLPPYNTWEKLSDIGTVYLAPCCVFFVLYESLSDVERHLVPLTRFYEEDPAWAKAHLAKSEMYQEEAVKQGAEAGREALCAIGRTEYPLDELLGEALKVSELHHRRLSNAPQPDKRPTLHFTLFKGLWPARLLLDPHLRDAESKRFRQAWLCFHGLSLLTQAVLLALLVGSAWQEWLHSAANHFPADAVKVGRGVYQLLGDGYCREDGMHRPDGYYAPLSDVPEVLAAQGAGDQPGAWGSAGAGPGGNVTSRPRSFRRIATMPKVLAVASLKVGSNPLDPLVEQLGRMGGSETGKLSPAGRTCGQRCSSAAGACVAFAVDQDLCNIYLRYQDHGDPPKGWTAFREDLGPRQRWNLPAVVVQTNGAQGVQCWARLKAGGEPQDLGGCIVHLLHAFFVLGVAVLSVFNAKG